jgi:hypothetical protein
LGEGLTARYMVELAVRLTNKLVVPAGRAGGEPQDEADVLIVEGPQRRRVSEQGVNVGRVEQAGTGIIEWNCRRTCLASEDGEDSRVQVTLLGLPVSLRQIKMEKECLTFGAKWKPKRWHRTTCLVGEVTAK